jgi:hypothetical protein
MPGSNTTLDHTSSIALFPSDDSVCLANTATAAYNSLFQLGFHQCSVAGVECNNVKKPGLHALCVAESYQMDHIHILQGQQDLCYLLNEKTENKLELVSHVQISDGQWISRWAL